jgi:hypothetical protein
MTLICHSVETSLLRILMINLLCKDCSFKWSFTWRPLFTMPSSRPWESICPFCYHSTSDRLMTWMVESKLEQSLKLSRKSNSIHSSLC